MLLLRLWVAQAFFLSGLTKIASFSETLMLFTHMYHVPLLSPGVAAYLGTAIELVFPPMLALGIAGRFAAGVLFFENIVAVISYPAIWSSGFTDHKVWGLMLLAIVLYGPGRLSVDHLIMRVFPSLDPAGRETLAPDRLNRYAAGLAGGCLATAAITLIMIVHRFRGILLSAQDPVVLLERLTHGGVALGWALHLVIGIVIWGLAFAALYSRIPGRPALRGVIFALGAWLLMMVVLMPLAGTGPFADQLGISGALAPLGLHVVYGLVLGTAFARLANVERSPARPATQARRARRPAGTNDS